jgi:microcystin-dependent protein
VINPSGSFGVTLYASTAPTGTLDPRAIAPSGASQPHNNMMPYLVLNYSIAMAGLFPPHDEA